RPGDPRHLLVGPFPLDETLCAERRLLLISIPQLLARQFRVILRKSAPAGLPRSQKPTLVLQAGHDGLHLRAQYPDVCLEYHLPGSHPSEVLTLPSQALDDFEGKKDSPVSLEKVGANTVRARWD